MTIRNAALKNQGKHDIPETVSRILPVYINMHIKYSFNFCASLRFVPKDLLAISEFHTYPSSPHRAACRKPWYICHATVRHAMPGRTFLTLDQGTTSSPFVFIISSISVPPSVNLRNFLARSSVKSWRNLARNPE